MLEQSPENSPLPRHITEIKRAVGSYNITMDSERIDEFVEEPLRLACHIFYDKNIQTVGSSANMESGQNRAFIYLNGESLSEENKKIAQAMGLVSMPGADWGFHGTIVSIELPLNEEMTVDEVSRHFVSVADQFVSQPPDWLPHHSIDEMEKTFGYSRNDPEDMAALAELCDQTTGFYYEEPEHLQKVLAWEEQGTR